MQMTSKEITSLREHVDDRLDAIEKLIRLSLLSSVMNQMDEVINQSEKEEVQRTEHLKDVLYEYYFEVGKEERHGDKTLIYLKCLRQINIPTVRWIYTLIRNIGQDLIPIFLFEKVNWNQRKKMLEDRISFCVLNKEIYIIG